IGEVKRDTTSASAEWLDADPDDLARGAERVEIGRLVIVDARGEDFVFEDRRRERIALNRFECFEDAVESAAASRHALPRCDDARERRLFDRFDFLAQLRE